jgi:YD repeat-containing protein
VTSSAPNGEIVTDLRLWSVRPTQASAHLPGGSVAGMDYDHLGHNTGITDPDAGRRTDGL